jgi:hypothetical protein
VKKGNTIAGFVFAVGFNSVVKGEIGPQLTVFSDEAWFHLQGYINTQNTSFRIFSASRHRQNAYSTRSRQCTSRREAQRR